MAITPDPSQNNLAFSVASDLSDLTAQYLKDNYLWSLNFVDHDGNALPDPFYQKKLAMAAATFERETKLRAIRRKVTDEKHDYYIHDYQLFAWIQLFEYPVISVEKVAVIYPTGQTVFEFPLEWVKLNEKHGQIQLVPTQGTLSQVILGRGGSYLPLIYQNIGYLPQLFHIDYTTGFANGQYPADVLDAICKLATIEILSIVGDSIFPPGVTSISAGIDGISQGLGIVNNGQLPAIFAGRINLYRKDLYGERTAVEGVLYRMRDEYKGLQLTVC